MTTESKALEAFVSAIDSTGGVVQMPDGTFAPACDDDWIDLGDAYIAACAALGRKPYISATYSREDHDNEI